MIFEEDKDFVPKTTTSKTETTPKQTHFSQEDKDAFIAQYTEWVKTFYPVDEFEIQDENGSTINFVRSNPLPFHENEKKHLIYFLKENGSNAEKSKAPATIWAFLEDKKFNFLVDWDSMGKGYGKVIYRNAQKILEILGIEDRENYSITVAHQPEHAFLQHMRTKDLLADTAKEPNISTAQNLLKKFIQHPYFVNLKDVNSIIEYAKKSGISDDEIAKSLNENGFLIKTHTISDNDLETFKNFNICGLRATNMHRTIMESKSFTPLLLLTNVDKNDVTMEFKRIIDDLQKDVENKKAKGAFIPSDLSEYGAIMHILLNWHNVPVMFQNLDNNIQTGIKKLVISTLDYFNEEHSYSGIMGASKTAKTIKNLAHAIPLDKDDYINIYMKMLNRNYTLNEFQEFVSYYVVLDPKVEEEGNLEIAQNSYYPSPKQFWQDDSNLDKHHKMRRIHMPQKAPKAPKTIRDIIKKEILKKGIAQKKKIKTDMTGVTEDGKIIQVDNLKDWLFGVPGAHGNLKITNSGKVLLLPPQTPLEAVRLIEDTVQEKFHSAPGGDGNR